MEKIAFVGGPNTGKTTTAMAVAAALNGQQLRAYYVDEIVRYFMTVTGRLPLSTPEQLYVAERQIEKERQAERTDPDYVVCDSPIFLTLPYSLNLKQVVPEMLGDLYGLIWSSFQTYDFVFFLKIVKPRKDGIVDGESPRLEALQSQMKALLDLHRVKYHIIESLAVNDRVSEVLSILGRKVA